MGREFKGEAFKPTPAVVLFKDFEVGQSYSQVITLTNISLARNTFKARLRHLHSDALSATLQPLISLELSMVNSRTATVRPTRKGL